MQYVKHEVTNKSRNLICFSLFFLISTIVSCNEYGEQTVERVGDIEYIHHSNGPTIGHSLNSGVAILQAGGAAFKDLNNNSEPAPIRKDKLINFLIFARLQVCH